MLVVGLIACKKNDTLKQADNLKADSTTQSESPAQTKVSKEAAVKQANDEILLSLKNKDYKKFSEFIHPAKGITFSMSATANPKEDKHFSREDFDKELHAKNAVVWGIQDGSGEPYKASVADYLNQKVFGKDFTTSSFSYNSIQGQGNSKDNIKKIYPDSDFTENYIKGSEKNGGMDWASLRLVFEEYQGKYYLVAVINDQWSI